jgi:hypothetical protein
MKPGRRWWRNALRGSQIFENKQLDLDRRLAAILALFCEHLKLDGDGLPILLLLPNFITAQTPLIPITIPA